jgi:hypothetical protein
MIFIYIIFVAYFTLSRYLIIFYSFLFTIATLSFMLSQKIVCESLSASFFLIFTIELDLENHIFQNWTDVNVLSMISLTVGTSLVLIFPTFDAGATIKFVLATVALNRHPIFCNYLITNAAKD